VIRALIAGAMALALGSCVGASISPLHPEARAFTARPDAMGDVEAALARAASSDKRVLLVMGANWCHDSRVLAGWLTAPRFAPLIAAHYELVFVDVGSPQTGAPRNLAVAQRFGLMEFTGTPALLVLTPQGRAVNLDSAASWRNAASRSEEAIFRELAALAASGSAP
jgi:hypothetical protein